MAACSASRGETRATADALPVTVGTAADRELAEAALPFTSGAIRGLPAQAAHLLAALRTALGGAHVKDLDELHASLKTMAAAGLQTPDSAEGRRLAAALHAYSTPTPTVTPAQAPAEAADAVDESVSEDADETRRDGR